MISSETNFKRKTLKYLRDHYPNDWFFKSSEKFISGIPDILACINGKFFAFELKVGSNKPTLLQAHVINKIRKAGGAAGVAYTIQDIKNIIERG